jgi:4-amino-4-deoxy-L-arabinose transferase-like glycosyltransferase
MSQFLTPLDAQAAARWRSLGVIGIGALTAARVIALWFSDAQLYPDEAQYWGWAQSLSFGYFSKPPLIAWVIALTTTLAGDTEVGIRLAAPFLHAAAAAAIFMLARRMADSRTGALAALTYAVSPAAWVSSGVISTDALLLPCWAFAMLAAWRLGAGGTPGGRGDWVASILLGFALGLGFLAKYAMVYALIALALWCWVDRGARTRLASRQGGAALAICGVILAPNLVWNAGHRFATVAHTAGEAKWGGSEWGLATVTDFLLAQFGVFGPVAFAALLVGLARLALRWRAGTLKLDSRQTFLLCFIAPPLGLVTLNAALSPTNANWAASAYPAASILVALWLLSWGRRLWPALILASGAGLGALMLITTTNFALVDAWGWNNAVKRVRAWDVTSSQIAAAAARGADGAPFQAVVFDMRFPYHETSFYGRAFPLPALRMWRRYETPRNQAEQTASLAPGTAGPVLLVIGNPRTPPIMQGDFRRIVPIGKIVTDLGPGRSRSFTLYAGWGYAPQPRNSAFEARWRRVNDEPDRD